MVLDTGYEDKWSMVCFQLKYNLPKKKELSTFQVNPISLRAQSKNHAQNKGKTAGQLNDSSKPRYEGESQCNAHLV